jgi:hypothetical protein
MSAERITAEDARRDLETGRAMLVCAYDDDAKCRSVLLEGAITLGQLRAREAGLPIDQELLFYCA